jgi:hypothetical protein
MISDYIEWNESLKQNLYLIETVNNGAVRRAVVTKNPNYFWEKSRSRIAVDLKKKLQTFQEHNGNTLTAVYDVWRDEITYIYCEATSFEQVSDTKMELYSAFHDAEFAAVGLVYLDGNVQRVTYATRNPQLLAMISQADPDYYSAIFAVDIHAFYDLIHGTLLRSDEIVNAAYLTSLYAEYLKIPRPMILEFQSNINGMSWR